MNYNRLLILLTILFHACTPSQEKSASRLKVNFSSGEFNSSYEFDQIKFIPLETKDENIIRNISKVVNLDSVYIVFSSRPDNCVAIHDTNGRYQYSNRNMGKGPGEFVSAHSMHVDSCIHVYDRGKTAIQTYDLMGRFVAEKPKVGFFSKFILYNNLLALYDFSDRPSRFQRIPLNHKLNVFDVTKKDHPKLVFSDIELYSHRQKYMNVILYNNFYLSKEELFYWTFPADTIFRLNMKSLNMEPFTLIDLGTKKITEDFLDKPWRSVREFATERRKRKLYSLYDFYALKKNIYCFMSSDYYIGFGHQETDNLVCYNKMQLFPIPSVPPVTFNSKTRMVGTIGDDRIIFSWEANDFIEYCKKVKKVVSPSDWEKILFSYPGLKRTIEETTEESNPVLMIATLK